MITEHQGEQGSLFALGALSGDERRAFQAELGGNPELRELVRDLQRTAVLLARAVPGAKPPPDLRERLLRRIEKTMDDADAPVVRAVLQHLLQVGGEFRVVRVSAVLRRGLSPRDVDAAEEDAERERDGDGGDESRSSFEGFALCHFEWLPGACGF